MGRRKDVCKTQRRTQPVLFILTVTAPASPIPLSGSLDPNLAPTVAQFSKWLGRIDKHFLKVGEGVLTRTPGSVRTSPFR